MILLSAKVNLQPSIDDSRHASENEDGNTLYAAAEAN